MEMIALDHWRPSHPRVAGFHDAQEVSSSASRVHPVTWGTDPLLGVVSSPEPAEVPQALARWAGVLDAAYGYRISPDHPRGISRRAPSAGALYPTEVLAIGRGGVYQYAFWDRRFHRAHACDAGAAARALGLGVDDLALVTVAVFWRTVQRYGIRGYRYCMLDAAHVMSNLISVIGARGGVGGLALAAPSSRLTRAMALPRSVGAVRALIVRSASQLTGDDRLAPAWTPRVHNAAHEHSPLLSPVLSRVARFHTETLDDAASPMAIGAWSTPATAVAARRSARSFTQAALPQATYGAIHHHLATRRPVLPVGADVLRNYVVRVRVQATAPGIERVDQGGEAGEVTLGDATSAELAARVRSMCQSQVIAGEGACAVVTGIRGHALRGATPAMYRDLVSEVGYLGAELGTQAVELDVATTTIGGFSDNMARHLAGDDGWFPIAIQLYGEAGRHGYKTDAASRVLENHAREEK
jgi:hypothetical protein